MARLGMTTLISTLRALTNATTSDATLEATTYFSDDHLQAILDATRHTWYRVALIPEPIYADGVPVYVEYSIPLLVPRAFEENAVDSGWAVRDSQGVLVDALDYTVNYATGLITFAADTEGASYVLYCRTYDLPRAASQVWLRKASFAYQEVDWSSDAHRLEASQHFSHALKMAEVYAAKAGATVARLLRRDEMVQ